MSDLKKSLQQQAKQASSASNVDLREEATTRSVVMWPAGIYRGRVVEVIELGLQPQTFEGQAKPPAEEVQLRVMLFPNQLIKKELGDDVQPLMIRLWPLAVRNSSRSKSKISFDRMNHTGEAKHFREFIGEAFRFKLGVRVDSTGKQFNFIDLPNTLPAIDEETGKPLAVPEAPDDKLILFTFHSPMKEMWAKLKIDGAKTDGTSKNFIQEKILAALNFKGSDVDRMLQGGSKEAALKVEDVTSEDELPEPPTDDEY